MCHCSIGLVVVENTDDTHNLIVCTLCSCYPNYVLGLPPRWYKSDAYRSRAVSEPRAVLEEFGVKLPEATAVHVWIRRLTSAIWFCPGSLMERMGWMKQRSRIWSLVDAMVGCALIGGPEQGES